MPILYEVVELTNGDIALQREGDDKGQPLVTMRFSTELLRFLRNGKLDIAKVMIEAGLEEVAKLAADYTEGNIESDIAAVSKQDSPDKNVTPGENEHCSESLDTTSKFVERRKPSLAAPRGRHTDLQNRDSRFVKKVTSSRQSTKKKRDQELLEAESVSQLIH